MKLERKKYHSYICYIISQFEVFEKKKKIWRKRQRKHSHHRNATQKCWCNNIIIYWIKMSYWCVDWFRFDEKLLFVFSFSFHELIWSGLIKCSISTNHFLNHTRTREIFCFYYWLSHFCIYGMVHKRKNRNAYSISTSTLFPLDLYIYLFLSIKFSGWKVWENMLLLIEQENTQLLLK